MMDSFNIVFNDELSHHGIKGQKWGIRRYQNKDGSLTSKGREHYSKNSMSNKKTNNSSKRINKDTKLSEIKGMDSTIKSGLLFTASYLAVPLTVYTVSHISQKIRIRKYNKEMDENKNNNSMKSLNDIPKLKSKMSPSESMKEVNKGFPGLGHVDNCMLCTTAMVMREKGYDVKATKVSHGLYEENITRMFNDAGKFKSINTITSKGLVDKLDKEGDGAYGNLIVTWKLGGSHSVFWKNEGGVTRIYDGQSGEEYDIRGKNSLLLSSIVPNGSSYIRLDKATPNENVLGGVLSASEKKKK